MNRTDRRCRDDDGRNVWTVCRENFTADFTGWIDGHVHNRTPHHGRSSHVGGINREIVDSRQAWRAANRPGGCVQAQSGRQRTAVCRKCIGGSRTSDIR